MSETDGLVNDRKVSKDGNASTTSGIFNIVNTIIGGGALALPWVFKESGVATGIVLVFIVAILSVFSQRLIVDSSHSAFGRPSSFSDLGKKAFGPRYGHYYTEGCVILFLIGAQVSYTVIIGKLLTPLVNNVGINVGQEVVSGVIAAVVILPLSSLRQMDSLRFTSFIALFFIFCLAVGVIVKTSQKLDKEGISSEFSLFGHGFSGIFVSLPVLNFAFTYHPSILPVWKELKNQSENHINFICIVSVFICGVFYIALGIFGYMFDYERTEDNILLSPKFDDYLFIALKLGYALVIIFSYPVLNYATRNGIDLMLFGTEAPWWRYVIESAFIVGITYLIGIFVPSIDIIFGFTGATVGQLVIFINPALFYIFLYEGPAYEQYDERGQRMSSGDSRHERSWKFYFNLKKLPSFIMIFAGIVCGALSVVEIILSFNELEDK